MPSIAGLLPKLKENVKAIPQLFVTSQETKKAEQEAKRVQGLVTQPTAQRENFFADIVSGSKAQSTIAFADKNLAPKVEGFSEEIPLKVPSTNFFADLLPKAQSTRAS